MPVGNPIQIQPKDQETLWMLIHEAKPGKESEYFPNLQKSLDIQGASRHQIALERPKAILVTKNCVVFLHVGKFTVGTRTIDRRGCGYPVKNEEKITLEPWTAVIITDL